MKRVIAIPCTTYICETSFKPSKKLDIISPNAKDELKACYMKSSISQKQEIDKLLKK